MKYGRPVEKAQYNYQKNICKISLSVGFKDNILEILLMSPEVLG